MSAWRFSPFHKWWMVASQISPSHHCSWMFHHCFPNFSSIFLFANAFRWQLAYYVSILNRTLLLHVSVLWGRFLESWRKLLVDEKVEYCSKIHSHSTYILRFLLEMFLFLHSVSLKQRLGQQAASCLSLSDGLIFFSKVHAVVVRRWWAFQSLDESHAVELSLFKVLPILTIFFPASVVFPSMLHVPTAFVGSFKFHPSKHANACR